MSEREKEREKIIKIYEREFTLFQIVFFYSINTQSKHHKHFFLFSFILTSQTLTRKMSKFERPADLSFPIIYHTFKAKDKDSDEVIEYSIQDLLEEDFEKAIEMMKDDYIPEESFCRCRNIENDKIGRDEILSVWREALFSKISVGCYKNDESKELVGLSIYAVNVKGFGKGSTIKVS